MIEYNICFFYNKYMINVYCVIEMVATDDYIVLHD